MKAVRKHEIAKMIDHSLLHPTMDDQVLKDGIELAKEYDVASVCIKPYAVKMGTDILAGTDVMVCTVIGFPHGNSRVDVKVFENDFLPEDTLKVRELGVTRIGTTATQAIVNAVDGKEAGEAPEGY